MLPGAAPVVEQDHYGLGMPLQLTIYNSGYRESNSNLLLHREPGEPLPHRHHLSLQQLKKPLLLKVIIMHQMMTISAKPDKILNGII